MTVHYADSPLGNVNIKVMLTQHHDSLQAPLWGQSVKSYILKALQRADFSLPQLS